MPIEFTSPPSDITEFVDAYHEGEELRFRRLDDIVGGTGPSGMAGRLLNDVELLLIDPPPGCRPISLKWVYKVKRDERGAIVKHKARLIAQGFFQHEGIDFEEVFRTVACMESI